LETIAQWLNDQMQQRKIFSVRRLARDSGLDFDRLSDWMVGRGNPNAEEIKHLANYFNVSPDQIKRR
jgi:hypothetical protein